LIQITNVAIYIFIFQEFLRFIFAQNKVTHIKERWFEVVVSFFMLLLQLSPNLLINLISKSFPSLNQVEIHSIYLTFIDLIIIIMFLLKSTKYFDAVLKLNLHPSALFALSFALIIFTGSIFLSLPKATVANQSTTYIDALFTSTSAVCVTGLVVHNTASHFTFFGQVVILALIQIGGLGVMTLTTFFSAIIAGGLSVKVRFLMKEYLSQLNVVSVAKLLRKILLYTFTIEAIGAIFLFAFNTNADKNNLFDRLFNSVFHSISAFCNAGFSTYENGLMQEYIQNNYLYLTIIMSLIVLGGLGFTVLAEMSQLLKYKNFKRWNYIIRDKFSVTTKIVLITTIFLIVFGSLFVFVLTPIDKTDFSSIFNTFFHSVFLSITSRTAGYNTVPIELITVPAAFIVIFLMWVGASPGSTGGGIKTTTFSLSIYSLYNQILGKERLELFKKEITPTNLRDAYLVVVANILALSVGIFFLLVMEKDKQPLDLVFEAVSAASTVGLSRNVTPFLGIGGKVVIILLMFIGRVGFLNFFLAFYKPSKEPNYHYTSESIIVG
jgi:potassium uptake TrkH family protein